LLNAGEKQSLVERGSPYSKMIVVVVVVVVFIKSKEIIVVGHLHSGPPLKPKRRYDSFKFNSYSQ
jgi:hypothetical protein